MKNKTRSTVSFHVGYRCKYCGIIFKSTHEFCTHKVEFHFTKLNKSRCIVFEESILQPIETELTNFRKAVSVVQVQPQFENMPMFKDNPSCVRKKRKRSEPVFISETLETSANLKINNPVSLSSALPYGDPKHGNNSDIKTESMEETFIKYEPSQQNEDLIASHTNSVIDPQGNDYYDKAATESNFITEDAHADANVDPTAQPQVTNLHQNPLEHSDVNVTQSTESMSSSFTADTEHEYLTENQTDSEDDITCLDDDPLIPSTSNKIPKPTGPTTTKITTGGINNSVFSQLELECEICSKQFSSSAQLGIHVGICKLYNSGKAVASTGPGPGPASRSVVRGKEEPVVRKGIVTIVKCQECFKLIQSHNFKKHGQFHQLRARRQYVCQICGKAFGSKANLDSHGGFHSDEAPNKCTFPGCYSAFKYKAGLYKHLKRHGS